MTSLTWLAVAVLSTSFIARADDECQFSNHFTVEFDGNESEAKELASQHGFVYFVKVFEEDNLYDFIRPEIPKCSSCESKSHVTLLQNIPKVKWVEQQKYRAHIVRHVIHDKQTELREVVALGNGEYLRVAAVKTKKDTIPSPTHLTFNDPFFKDQWYLHNEGQTGGPPGNDLNVLAVWEAGFTGRGVILSVLDDGLQHTNPDIHTNYEPTVSFDLVDFDTKRHDPMPDGKPENSHGTYCAGVIAAVANNTICGVGVAFNAKVGGIRVLDGPVTDLQEALALTLALDKVDVYSASWGPQDDGKHLSGPATLASRAFKKGIEKGRGGRGAVYVWAVGNGGPRQDNCNMDGYVSSVYTLAVSALTEAGLSAYYTEPCAATLASTFVGGTHEMPIAGSRRDVIREIRKIKIVVPGLDGECIESFQGTSAAAPMAAGIIALVLEANPDLTWRDVQHVVVEGARLPSISEPGWQINGAGYHFHLLYGFGVMDAALMVSLAQEWTNVGRMNTRTMQPISDNVRDLHPGKNTTLYVSVEPATGEEGQVNYLEYVVIYLDVKHPCRGKLEIFIISPAGTQSQVLTLRPHDITDKGIRNWGFVSAHFWGEQPIGLWAVRVIDHTRKKSHSSVRLNSLRLMGTAEKWKFAHVFDPFRLGRAFYPNASYLRSLATLEKRIPTIKINSKYIEVPENVFFEGNDVSAEYPVESSIAFEERFPKMPRFERQLITKNGGAFETPVGGSSLRKLRELLGVVEKFISRDRSIEEAIK